MKNIIYWVIVNIVLTKPVFALQGENALTNPLQSQSIADLVKNIAALAAKIGITVAAIFIIYSGILFVTARGSEEQLKKAKTNFMWAILGTAILLGAWVLATAIATTVKGL
ncbi:MAG: hypothetical protein NTX55_00800 [Candidatus Parcubacteria bacterium]|nr:hypothetical protein [Candidatus Parcubacteria bacterium]